MSPVSSRQGCTRSRLFLAWGLVRGRVLLLASQHQFLSLCSQTNNRSPSCAQKWKEVQAAALAPQPYCGLLWRILRGCPQQPSPQAPQCSGPGVPCLRVLSRRVPDSGGSVCPLHSLRPQLLTTLGLFSPMLLCCVLTQFQTWSYDICTDSRAEGPSDLTLDAEAPFKLIALRWLRIITTQRRWLAWWPAPRARIPGMPQRLRRGPTLTLHPAHAGDGSGNLVLTAGAIHTGPEVHLILNSAGTDRWVESPGAEMFSFGFQICCNMFISAYNQPHIIQVCTL